jgi:ABC-2 type transport system ATP-binding protein
MIKVEGLTKRYGDLKAVEDISFYVKKGEIVGFLGPNGAGKTTTMRVITGFLPATEGTVTVSGFDIFEKPMEVKKRIGYLPEHPPVYEDMTVKGYSSSEDLWSLYHTACRYMQFWRLSRVRHR